ncbi:ROK family protein [Catenulispora yoronensis]
MSPRPARLCGSVPPPSPRTLLRGQGLPGTGVAGRPRLAGAGRPGREPLAVGVSTIGIPRENGVDLAPNIPGWAELALAQEVQDAFPDSEIRVETDVKAAARVEAVEGALRDADPGLYLNLGTGLAVALVAGGEVVAGRNGASGEIGYNLRSVADVGAAAGQRSILEDGVSGIGLLARARELVPGATGAKDLFAAVSTDERAAAVLKEFTDELAFHLVNLAIALDPARIAVGGGMVRSWAALHGPLRRALDAAVPFPRSWCRPRSRSTPRWPAPSRWPAPRASATLDSPVDATVPAPAAPAGDFAPPQYPASRIASRLHFPRVPHPVNRKGNPA